MKKTILYSFLLLAILSACNRNKKAITRFDTPTSGEAMIVCDECFAPIIQEEIAVFTGLNQSAHITPIFTSENEAFKLLTTDSIRLAIVSRELTEQEKTYLKKFKRVPRTQQIAIDGIALIINKENTDSLLSISALQKIMTGKIEYWDEISSHKKEILQPITVVFDNQNSSTLRFIKDSVCLAQPIGKKLNAASSNQAVIDYVSKHPHALGVIGVNWISNPDDSTKLSFNNTIRVMSISRNHYPTPDNSYKPF
ncbi:MAG: substrate-binding domain-containing protein, partial [Bacteroidales bacterium]